MPTNTFAKIKSYALTHKIVSTIIVLIILFISYKILSPKTAAGQTRYTLGTVQQGILISSVSESGQVSATNSVSVQAKATGDITWVGVKPGDTVSAGQALASIDDTTAKQAIADAKASLAEAQLQYQKDQAQAPIDYQNSQNTLATDKTNLTNEYNNTYDVLSTTYLDLPNITTGMNDILYGYDLNTNKTQDNEDMLVNLFSFDQRPGIVPFQTSADSDYTAAETAYNPALTAYKQSTRDSDPATLEALLAQTVTATTDVAQALQSELNFLGQENTMATQYDVRLPSVETTLQTNARNYLTTVNNDLNSLLAEQKSIQTAKDAITTDQQNISLLQVGDTTGNNPISLQISQSSLAKQQVDLQNMEDNLADYTVVAPFAGTISAVTAVVGDNAGTVATLITTQQIATLSLNEVDVAKITLGDKATLTFDAIDGLTITGTVAEIDSVGTVSQGVVSYNVQITFDTQDPQVKPGMTVNAIIQTAVHQNALYVPSSAVKTVNGVSTVQVFTPEVASSTITAAGSQGVLSPVPPVSLPVTTGISNNTDIEILSGLTLGQQIVTRTTTTTSTAAKTTTTSAATTRGGAGGFGGGGRTLLGG
jgi:HlyD family secretion protein